MNNFESENSKGELSKPKLFIILTFTSILIVVMFFKCQKNQQDLEKMFAEFMTTYARNYTNFEERNKRFEIFVKNLKFHEEEEKRHDGLDLGVTQFSDWTDSEIRYLIPNKTMEIPETILVANFNIQSCPENFDLRNLTKVPLIKNQGHCGSCWAFSTVAAVEILISMKKQKLVDLSEQELVDCASQNRGCTGGRLSIAMNFVQNVGLCTEKEYQYRGVQGSICSINRNHTRVFIDGFAKLESGEDSISYWVYKNGPVAFLMNTTKTLLSYRSGIFHPTSKDCHTKSFGYHAMTIVGYGVTASSKQYWIVKNSWGAKWGENGYMRLARGFNICGMTAYVFAPILE